MFVRRNCLTWTRPDAAPLCMELQACMANVGRCRRSIELPRTRAFVTTNAQLSRECRMSECTERGCCQDI